MAPRSRSTSTDDLDGTWELTDDLDGTSLKSFFPKKEFIDLSSHEKFIAELCEPHLFVALPPVEKISLADVDLEQWDNSKYPLSWLNIISETPSLRRISKVGVPISKVGVPISKVGVPDRKEFREYMYAEVAEMLKPGSSAMFTSRIGEKNPVHRCPNYGIYELSKHFDQMEFYRLIYRDIFPWTTGLGRGPELEHSDMVIICTKRSNSRSSSRSFKSSASSWAQGNHDSSPNGSLGKQPKAPKKQPKAKKPKAPKKRNKLLGGLFSRSSDHSDVT